MENTFFKNLTTTSASQLNDAKSITTQKLQLSSTETTYTRWRQNCRSLFRNQESLSGTKKE